MGWIYFCLLAWAAAIILVPARSWKKYWPVGIAGMVIIYFIDNTLISLKAFRFLHSLIAVAALPLAYWISYFPGAILFAHYRPKRNSLNIAYILITAFLLLAAELVMTYSGYFQYIHWNAFNSYVLNILGFIVLFWINELIESIDTNRNRV